MDADNKDIVEYKFVPVEYEIDKDPAKVEEAYKEQEKIIGLIREAGLTMCELARRLIPFRDNKMWNILGYKSFQEWYQNVGISKTTIYRAIDIFETFVLQFHIPEEKVYSCDIKKLDMLLPLKNVVLDGQSVMNKDNAEEWLNSAKELSQSDLIYEINRARKRPSVLEEIMESEVDLYVGTYVLVKSDEDVSQLKRITNKKIPVELYRDDDGNYIVRLL
jgi:hypothetical protein